MSLTKFLSRTDGYFWAATFVALAWLVFCWPWFWGGKIIPNDAKNHFYPMVRFLAASWHSGESPFWSPYHYGGFPMVADPQSVIFTPSFWPAVLAGPVPSMRLVDMIHLLHLFAAGLAILGFARLRGWRSEAAVAAALGFMFAGALTIRLEHLLMTVSTMWLAVCLWRLEAVFVRGGVWRAIAFGLALGLLLIDRNHVAYLGVWFLVFYWLSRSWPWAEAAVPIRRQGAVMLGGLVAFCLSAVPVLLLLQLADLSNRPGFGYEAASFQSLHPAALVTLVLPDYFGALDRFNAYWGPSSAAWGEKLFMHRGMLHGYAGALAVVLILWRGLAAGGIFRREAMTYFLIAAVFLIYALGRYTPVFELFYHNLPGVDLFRRPSDALFLVGAALALLTGTLMNDGLRTQMRCSSVGITVVVMLVGGASAILYQMAAAMDRLDEALAAAVRALLYCGALMGLLYLAQRARQSRQRILLGLALLISAGDLITAGTNARLNALTPRHYSQQENPQAFTHFADLIALLETRDPSGAAWRVETVGLGATVQNIGQAAGFQALLGYNPIRLKAFDDQIAPNHQNNAGLLRNFGSEMTSYGSDLADRLGLRYLLIGGDVAKVDSKLREGQLQLLKVTKHFRRQVHLYENFDALPRARVFYGAKAADAPPRITRYGNTEIWIEAECDAPCRLVLHDFVYPGWYAWVNGVRTPIETQDGLFRAVDLSKGGHEVVFRFQPLALESLSTAVRQVLGGAE